MTNTALRWPDGLARVVACPFTFDTPDLLTGAAVYTPTVGDVLLDAWIEVTEAWDGTTSFCDVGTFTDRGTGLIYAANGGNSPRALTDPDSEFGIAGLVSDNTSESTRNLASMEPAGDANTDTRIVPGRFVDTAPLKVVVSSDGTNTGTDPGSTQGAAVLYLVLATPASR